jgi:DNA-binding MarR family transcriptional regulator
MSFVDDHALRNAFVGNQLERLVELIVMQGDELLEEAEIDLPSRAASMVLLIGERGEISAADAAKALGLQHQIVTHRIEQLIELRILKRFNDPKDGRRKLLSLTAKGVEQLRRLRARLVLASAAFSALFAEVGVDLPAGVMKISRALKRATLLERIRQPGARS